MTPKICLPGYSHILACEFDTMIFIRALSGTWQFTWYKLTVRVTRICSGYGYHMPYLMILISLIVFSLVSRKLQQLTLLHFSSVARDFQNWDNCERREESVRRLWTVSINHRQNDHFLVVVVFCCFFFLIVVVDFLVLWGFAELQLWKMRPCGRHWKREALFSPERWPEFTPNLQKLISSTMCCLQGRLVLPQLWFWKSMIGEKNMGEERRLLAPFISAVICL